jgi:hypothetical protein
MRPHATRAETAAVREETMHRLRGLAAALLLVLAVPLVATDPLKVFADQWKGATVVLKKPLYTFAYARDAINFWQTRCYGVTRIAPGKGIYYLFTAARPSARTTADTDVQRLAQRARAAAGYQSTMTWQRTGQLGTNDHALPILAVITYDAGTELVVKKILYGVSSDNGLKIELTLPQEPAAEPVTHLFVEWPASFSAEFVERPKVEELMAEFFERVKR